MFRRTCAHNNLAAFLITRSAQNALRNRIFFLILAIILIISFFTIPAFSAEEKAVEQTSIPAISVPDGTKPQASTVVLSSPKVTTQIVVNVIVNTESKGDFFCELDEQQNLFIKVEDVKTLMLQYAEGRIVIIRGDEQFVPINALLDVTYDFDEKKLTVAIIGKTTASGKTAADLFSLQSAAKNIYYPRETSAFVNYALNYAYTGDDGFQSFAVTNKAGFRTGDVFFTSDSVYSKTETSDNFVRLQSSATYERRGELQWFVLGDEYANSGDLGSTVNMGGIGFSKVYRLDPYFITQPVMDLRGSVIFPSQAEIYLDGVLIGKQAIAPGSFDLKNLYAYTGSHNVEVLLKDPFGNVQKISYLAYFSSQMLREGLHEYSYNVGFLREKYGVESNEYGEPVFSAFHRYGVTNNFNVGARAEGSDGTYNGGISTSFAVPRIGQFGLSLAGSYSADSVWGGAISLQHSFQLGSFSTNLLLREYSWDYATVGNPLPTLDSTQFAMSMGMGLMLNPLGSFSINYAETETFKGINTRNFSLNYSRTLYKSISLFATGSATHTMGDTNYSFFVGLNFDLAKDIRGSAQASAGSGDVNTETLQIQKDIPVGEGVGYRASVNRSETTADTVNSFNPYVQYNARYGIYSVDARIQDSAQGDTTESYNLSAAGSVVYAGGFFGISRPVSDSFGIVALNKEVPGASVLNNGQEIGKTGSFGTMVVPTLASYGQNKITLDTKNIPLDYSISDVNKSISPSLWSGSCVYFDAQQVRALTGKLLTEKEGKKTPLEFVEISLKVGEKSVLSPTGKGGEFYLENSLSTEPGSVNKAADNLSCRAIAERIKSGGNTILPGTYRANVEYEGGKCEFPITFPETSEAITEIGEIMCDGSQTTAQPVAVPTPSVVTSPSFPTPMQPVQEPSPIQALVKLSDVDINQMVKLKDIRRRVVNNNILGQIAIVEGIAVNQADYPISRIVIKGEMIGANSVVLGEYQSYAGNLLTDEELTNLSEEEIQKKLSRPEGLKNYNDRIMPHGQVYFMIVFSRMPAGVIKTTVMPIGVGSPVQSHSLSVQAPPVKSPPPPAQAPSVPETPPPVTAPALPVQAPPVATTPQPVQEPPSVQAPAELSDFVINQLVKLKDIRRRLVNNNILGQIVIVEGIAVNQAEYPVSRIVIRGAIFSANSEVLGEQTSYAGNILTDEELTNLSEEEMQKKLSRPEGLKNSNDRIMPNRQIHFMIIFSREPAGVIKTTVMPIGAKLFL